MEIVKYATCTFCGCVCDDIELHAEGHKIVKAKNACSLGDAHFKYHTAERHYPDALDRRQARDRGRGGRSGGRHSLQRQHAAGVRAQQRDVRDDPRRRGAGRNDWRRGRQSHLVCDTVQRRSPPSWVAKLLARSAKSSKEPISSCIGAGTRPSAIRATSPSTRSCRRASSSREAARTARWCSSIFAKRRPPRRPTSSCIIRPGKDFELYHDPAGDDEGPARRTRPESPKPA